jgi:hypothetical protein
MRKQLVIIGIITLLVCVGLSGCEQINDAISSEKTLPDGTKVTGDINQIEITNNSFYFWQTIYMNCTSENIDDIFSYSHEADWDVDIGNIMTNFTKRKIVCDKWFSDMYFSVYWNKDYSAFSTGLYSETIESFRLDHEVHTVVVVGDAKNIGKDFLYSPTILVNYYNKNGAWLASETSRGDNIPSGYTWDFVVYYDGEFRSDVSYISFEVKAKPYG